MSVDYFVCESCGEPLSEYHEFQCENEHTICTYCLPKDLQNLGSEDSHYGVCVNDLYGICRNNWNENKEVLQKYIVENEDYGYVLKKEWCPICQKEEKYKDDPQYQEYLRLKKIYEGE